MRGIVLRFATGVAFAMVVLMSLSLPSGSALSATLTIQKGATESDLISVSSDLSGFSLSALTAETTSGGGYLVYGVNSTSLLASGNWIAGLAEPDVKGIVSDYLVLFVDNAFKDPNNGFTPTQHVAFTFVSEDMTNDEFKTFLVLSQYGFGGIVPETDNLVLLPFRNICADDDCSTSLEIYVQSSSFETPLPATLPLFATGLGALGLLGSRRRRQAAALAD